MIAIIGILIALLLPAVQAAREAARRTQCHNHLKQLALGACLHEQAHRFLPSGGWGFGWNGDPDRGVGRTQSGSWLFSILPYIEQQNLYELGVGTTGTTKTDAIKKLTSTPVSIFHCPSRRSAIVYPATWSTYYNASASPAAPVAKTDYAANSGAGSYNADLRQPTSAAQASDPNFAWTNTSKPSTPEFCSGVVFYRSEVAIAHIRDGTTNTYLCGEKYMNPDTWRNGTGPEDNQSAYTGFEWDSLRLTNIALAHPPMQDRAGLTDGRRFGSNHAGGFGMALCDGSVRTISYGIDAETHRRMGDRRDGEVVDAARF